MRFRSTAARLLLPLVVVSLIAAACGDDGENTDASPQKAENASFPEGVDVNGDGMVTIGYVVAGDRNDGGFYQGQVEAVEEISDAEGYETIIVDKVNPGAAKEAFENLARQGPDLIIGGGSELTDGFAPVSESPEFSDINFLLIAGVPPSSDSFATAAANENEAHFMGGVAAALLLERAGKDKACVVAGPELEFVKDMGAAMTDGLAYVDESLEMLVTFTGDFEDAGLAEAAATAQINQGCQVIYPYLGGALTAVVKAGNDAGIDVVSTSVDLCGVPDFDVAMSIMYNPALFLGDVIELFVAGELVEGELLEVYGVGSDTGVGAKICDATPEEERTLDEVREKIVNGEIDVDELLENE